MDQNITLKRLIELMIMLQMLQEYIVLFEFCSDLKNLYSKIDITEEEKKEDLEKLIEYVEMVICERLNEINKSI